MQRRIQRRPRLDDSQPWNRVLAHGLRTARRQIGQPGILQQDREKQDEQDAKEERGHGCAEESQRGEEVVEAGILFDGRKNTQRDGDHERERRGDHHELQGLGEAAEDKIGHRAVAQQLPREAEVAQEDPPTGAPPFQVLQVNDLGAADLPGFKLAVLQLHIVFDRHPAADDESAEILGAAGWPMSQRAKRTGGDRSSSK